MYDEPEPVEMLAVIFYDSGSKEQSRLMFFSREGGDMYSLEPGQYLVLCYNLGTDYTFADNLDRIDRTVFTTSSTGRTSSGKLIAREPDHVFACIDTLEIPVLSGEEDCYEISLNPEPVLESWKLVIDGVSGLENAVSAGVYVGSQNRFYSVLENGGGGEALLSLDMLPCVDAGRGVISGCFNTFGMSDTGTILLQVVLAGGDGAEYSELFDVTEQVRDPENVRHEINIRYEVSLSGRGESGLDPSADKWDENVYKYEIR